MVLSRISVSASVTRPSRYQAPYGSLISRGLTSFRTRSLSLPNKPGLSGIPPLNQNSKAKGESLDRGYFVESVDSVDLVSEAVYSLASPSSTESSIAINPVFLAVIASGCFLFASKCTT